MEEGNVEEEDEGCEEGKNERLEVQEEKSWGGFFLDNIHLFLRKLHILCHPA